MADEMFAQLDRLQQGARQTRPRRQEYEFHNSNSRYDAYETQSDYYDGNEMYGDENTQPQGLNGRRTDTSLTPPITE